MWDKFPDYFKAVQEDDVAWPQIFSLREATDLYDIHAIPYTLLISPEGKVVAGGMHGADIDKVLELAKEANKGKL